MAAPPLLVGLHDAARALAMSPWAVRDLIASGALTPVMVPCPPDRRGRRAAGVIRKTFLAYSDLAAFVRALPRTERRWSAPDSARRRP